MILAVNQYHLIIYGRRASFPPFRAQITVYDANKGLRGYIRFYDVINPSFKDTIIDGIYYIHLHSSSLQKVLSLFRNNQTVYITLMDDNGYLSNSKNEVNKISRVESPSPAEFHTADTAQFHN